MPTNTPSPAQLHSPLRIHIVTDENGTERLYRGTEYIGLPNSRETQLCQERDALCSALEDALECLKRMPEVDGAYRQTVMQQIRQALAQSGERGE